jgi:uncharacterized membrane protein YphA (DoxX/SURF4 family)
MHNVIQLSAAFFIYMLIINLLAVHWYWADSHSSNLQNFYSFLQKFREQLIHNYSEACAVKPFLHL